MSEIAQDVVTVCITSRIVNYMETVDIKYDDPVGVIQQLTAFVSFAAGSDELITVSYLSDLINIRKTLNKNILFMLLSYIEKRSTEKRKHISCSREGLVTERVPAVRSSVE